MISASPCMHSFMEIWVPLYGSVFVACHLISALTPCLECVHASVDEFMSIWLPMFGPAPMHSLMETWVPLFVTVHVSQSPYLWSPTFFRMCTCISTGIYVHLTAIIWSSTMHTLMSSWVPLYGSVFVSQSHHFWSHTLFRMCTCNST